MKRKAGTIPSELEISVILLLLTAVLAAGYFLSSNGLSRLTSYLSKNNPVNASLLVVEGWLPEEAIDKVPDELSKNRYSIILTTGLISEADYFKVSMNGFLVFYPKGRFDSMKSKGSHTVEISAYSETDGENSSHFNLFVNDSLISGFRADKIKRKYNAAWKGIPADIDSIMIQFDNDAMGEFGDRNLYVREIIIDNKVTIPVMNNSAYNIDKAYKRERIINNYDSHAEHARKKLIALGTDSGIIKALPCKRTKLNRTLTSALEVHDWLKENHIQAEGINIISAGIHSRRTWMIYNKILGCRHNKIGIICFSDYNNSYIGEHQKIKTIREVFANIYYWFILLPYQAGILK